MSGRIYKCQYELSDLLPKGENGCTNGAHPSSLNGSNDISPNVIASATCDGSILRLQFDIKLDVAAIRSDETTYLRSVLQFTMQLEKIIKDSGLENYLKQK